MLKGGGTLLLSTQGPLFGPGHAGILINNGKSWFTSDFEGDTRMGGKATLAIMPLAWKSGWPQVKVVDK
jgi:arabinan endo-1,5-alpha-L-arabinosidase